MLDLEDLRKAKLYKSLFEEGRALISATVYQDPAQQPVLRRVQNWPDISPEERARGLYEFIWALERGFQEGECVGRAAAQKEAFVLIASLFRLLADKRFPGLQLGAEVEAVRNLDQLHGLCHELDQIPDPETLRRRLTELAAA